MQEAKSRPVSEGGGCGTKRVSLEFLSTLGFRYNTFWRCSNGDRMVGEAVDLQTKWLVIVDSMLSLVGHR